MRIEWWRDTIDDIYEGNPPALPLAETLAPLVKRHRLTKRWFTRYLDARATDFDNRPHLDIKSVEDYAENTNSTVFYLSLECAGIRDVNADHAASHFGKAVGISLLLRSIPHVASQGIVPLPLQLMKKHAISKKAVLEGQLDKNFFDAIFDLACVGKEHVDHARSFQQQVPLDARRVLLPALAASNYLEDLEKYNFDVFHPKLNKLINPLFLQLQMWKHYYKKTY
eukprot:TRINITY_DN4617_c0_g1_i1.p1 TRINITY_DN4617_c0_g1~~TRINITY_DN4617_c0_g1_i1.p1  ORF type:complete len:225 (-),score=22.71 TRINITY_DN4617_c0_g1_i1:61-735(-)